MYLEFLMNSITLQQMKRYEYCAQTEYAEFSLALNLLDLFNWIKHSTLTLIKESTHGNMPQIYSWDSVYSKMSQVMPIGSNIYQNGIIIL